MLEDSTLPWVSSVCVVCDWTFTPDGSWVISAVPMYGLPAESCTQVKFCRTSVVTAGTTALTVTVKAPATSHEVRVSKIEAWLQSGGAGRGDRAWSVGGVEASCLSLCSSVPLVA